MKNNTKTLVATGIEQWFVGSNHEEWPECVQWDEEGGHYVVEDLFGERVKINDGDLILHVKSKSA